MENGDKKSNLGDRAAVILIAHGTVEDLADLPQFLANIRRGHAAPPELVAEVRRRYEAIGGKSPLNDISRSLAVKLEARLGLPVRLAMRLFAPYPKEVLTALAAEGRDRIAVVPLAQHSAKIYGTAVADAAKELETAASAAEQPGCSFVVRAAENWGRNPNLNAAFEGVARSALTDAGVNTAADVAATTLLFTAHSLPKFIIDAGDPYDVEVNEAARDIGARLRSDAALSGLDVRVCYQSQGMSQPSRDGKPQPWLGPDLRASLEDLARAGKKRVIVAPIGFLADHVEILYDLDIEASAWAKELGISFSRTRSLNDGEPMVRAIEDVARGVLSELATT
jgi:ferrochelatase